jgi:bifunctional non-homologous end joining protein LigD
MGAGTILVCLAPARSAMRPPKKGLRHSMPLLRLAEPFDHLDWLFEVKPGGSRALAHVDGHRCDLVSRNGHVQALAAPCESSRTSSKAHEAVINGEIVCLDARGRSNFKSLLFRHQWPCFYTFDLLAVDGEDVREWPLWSGSDG